MCSIPGYCVTRDTVTPASTIQLHPNVNEGYYHAMAKAKKFELDDATPVVDDEDDETLAAIDEGIRDAESGRTVPAEEARKLLPKWISASSTRKER